ncbi:choice-of-anchor W domain-containing protein [Paracraurococcus ruber]|uniref:VPLPA-CTERM protein sorting domain-containing protein n=1 Tax=Paracraurococcus ruber TaxID=77675 RepID=A0ABS1D0V0_9PROT|nr:choice-of-anchor W domain-containing protein [Paracraurococcus ruber]MBK1660111.1 hypothetical protein [Paracraurococcus ruber]TDG34114.1 hypothetical protein E2C05_01160 [Paracraurococcus ruber]
MVKSLFAASVAIALALAAPAQAAPSVAGVFSSDSDFLGFLAGKGVSLATDELFVAQARGGVPGSSDYEIGLHIPPGFTSAAPLGTAGQLNWVSGTAVPFTLARNAAGVVTFTMAGYAASYAAPALHALGLRVGALLGTGTTAASAALTNLKFDGVTLSWNGNPLGLTATAPSPALAVVADLPDVFSLTGDVTLAWTGAFPTRSRLAVQIKGLEGYPAAVPTPAALGLLLTGLLGLAGVTMLRRGPAAQRP